LKTIKIQEFIKVSQSLPIIDVRTPAEFSDGHITGAINIPIFSNEERAVVGTKYKQESRDTAIAKALEYIAEKTDHYLDELQKISTIKMKFAFIAGEVDFAAKEWGISSKLPEKKFTG